MEIKNTGGCAFPCNVESNYLGMTLRDYFAAKAMHALVAEGELDRLLDVPEYAYQIADAMLAERDGGQ